MHPTPFPMPQAEPDAGSVALGFFLPITAAKSWKRPLLICLKAPVDSTTGKITQMIMLTQTQMKETTQKPAKKARLTGDFVSSLSQLVLSVHLQIHFVPNSVNGTNMMATRQKTRLKMIASLSPFFTKTGSMGSMNDVSR